MSEPDVRAPHKPDEHPRHRIEAVMIAGGWAVMAWLFWDSVLVVVTSVVAVMALVVADIVHGWRRGGAARPDAVHWSEFALGVGAWFWGGLFVIALSFTFMHQPGINEALGAVPTCNPPMESAVAATSGFPCIH